METRFRLVISVVQTSDYLSISTLKMFIVFTTSCSFVLPVNVFLSWNACVLMYARRALLPTANP